MKTWTSRRIPLLIASLLLSACAAQTVPSDRYYRIALQALDPIKPLADSPQIMLEPFQASGVYAERALVYRRPEARGALEQYRQQFWLELPALMLTDSLRQALRKAFGDERVQARDARVKVAYVVTPRLRKLDQILGPEGARAEYEVEFVVTDEDNETHFVERVDLVSPLADTHPQSFADAVGRMAAQANQQLIDRLARDITN